MQEIFRAFEAEIDSVLDGERAVVARINNTAVDRLNTVIDPLGCNVTHFNKTRSVLWQHGQDPIRGTVPIGSGWVKVRRSEGDMLGKTSFAKDDFSSQLFDAYKEGTIRGWSIKAAVQEASPPTKEEIRSRPDLEGCEMVYRKWDLIEYSATPTPGNSDCLSLLVSRGLITPPEGYEPPTIEKQLAAVIENVPALLEAMGSKLPAEHKERWVDTDGQHWFVTEPDGTRIAKFRDEPTAFECIRAMENSRSFEQTLIGLHTEQRARFEQQKDDLLAEIALRQWGII